MTKPITPEQAAVGPKIPDEVFEAFNELICEGGGTVKQDAVVQRIMSKMPNVQRHEVFAKGWLGIEGAYREAGWKVKYDKPGFNESYEAYFEFTPTRTRTKR